MNENERLFWFRTALVVVVVALLVFGFNAMADTRIVPPGTYPWAVQNTDSNTGTRCTGAMISDRHLITPASCISGDGIVEVGFWNRAPNTTVLAKRFVYHPSYMPDGIRWLQSNLVIVELESEITHAEAIGLNRLSCNPAGKAIAEALVYNDQNQLISIPDIRQHNDNYVSSCGADRVTTRKRIFNQALSTLLYLPANKALLGMFGDVRFSGQGWVGFFAAHSAFIHGYVNITMDDEGHRTGETLIEEDWQLLPMPEPPTNTTNTTNTTEFIEPTTEPTNAALAHSTTLMIVPITLFVSQLLRI